MTTPAPTLSVVIPVHDGERTVGRAVASVARQKNVAVEVVVVDDGSTDRSAEAARECGAGRIIHQRRAGVAGARNAGVVASTAPLVAFLDADDEVEPGWAAALVTAAGGPGVGLASCAIRRREDDGSSSVVSPRPMGPAFGGITASFLAGSFAVRRPVFEQAGGYTPGLRFGENFELGLRLGRALAELGLAAAVVPEAMAVWNHSGARSHHPMAVLESAELVLRRHAGLLARDRALLSDHRAVAGVNAARVGDLAGARRHFLGAAWARPSVRGAGRLVAAVVPPAARRAWPPAAGRPPRLAAPGPPMTLGTLPTATVVIACRDGGAGLVEQVKAVAPQLAAGQSELILADNGSLDGSVERVLALGLPLVRSVAASDRPGQSHARNAGAKAGTGDVVLFLDQDDRVGTGYLDAMRSALAGHSAAAARLCLDGLNDPITARSRRPAQVDGLGEGLFPWAYGGSLGIDRALFDALGGFDEDLSPGEDVDLCFRMHEHYDAELVFVPDAVLDYRLRRGGRAVFRQGRAYGRTGPELYLRHRRYGLHRDALGEVGRLWAGLARSALSADRGRRQEALFVIGARAGRLEGSVRRLVWYP